MANKPFAESFERIYRFLTTGSTTLATTELTRKGVIESASLIAEDAVLAASATKPGLVELATAAEVTTGTDATRAVTPKALADAGFSAAHADEVAASTAVAGVVELATNVEARAVTSEALAVTPYGLGHALTSQELMSFTGKDNVGACTATGLKVGDVVVALVGLTDMGDQSASFEAIISVDDQIQQVNVGNLTAKNFLALVYRAVAPV